MTKLIQRKELKKIIKRDGVTVDFDANKVLGAVYKAMLSTREGGENEAVKVVKAVLSELVFLKKKDSSFVPRVEEVQDLVEKHLILQGWVKTSKAFILYRKQRADIRARNPKFTERARKEIRESGTYFRSSLSEFVYYTSYSRWIEEKGRRETWMETVDRFMNFMRENLKKKLTEIEYGRIEKAILNQEVIPSMRLLWSSGLAARVSNVCAYNCSFVTPTRFKDFGEIMYISMCGCGVGFTVEKRVIDQLPMIKVQNGVREKKYAIADSKEGWADAFVLALKTWYEGRDIEFDYSKIRPKGARLKTMGGRASGPEPLKHLMKFTKEKILSRQGKRLSSVDVHDVICKIGDIVIAGGVRRSAMISLSDLDDLDMRHAKDGQFYLTEPQRSMANNSAIYEVKPGSVKFLEEWLSLAKSGSGERGMFNRGSLEKQLPKRRWERFKYYLGTCGTNPCGEIILRAREFCNLTAIVVRDDDDLRSLLSKIKLATVLGTYQASLMNFSYLSSEWKKNCEEEALLGVSFTGYFDNKIIRNADVLEKLRKKAVIVNKEYAKRFEVNPSTCVTCVKPSGNSSQLLDTASGMHPRFAKYYIRRVRVSATDPIFRMLKDQGVPYYPEVGQREGTATTFVLEFPVKSPKGAVLKDDMSALELLEEWKKIKENFTEHNPSATIYVGDGEWLEVASWIYKNWDIIGGLSFLPRSGHVYQLAPYEEIDAKKYKELCKKVSGVDFSKLVFYEHTDQTKGAKQLACTAGGCEL